MDEGPDPSKNEDPGDMTGPIYTVRIKKRVPRASFDVLVKML
jgi:hypothetical protein